FVRLGGRRQQVRLRIQLRESVFDFRQRRQVLELPQSEIIEELLGRAEHLRFARHIAMSDHAYPIAFEQRADDVRADGDAANLLDLRTSDRLAVRDERKRLEQRTRISRRPLLPERRQPVGNRALDLDSVAARHLLQLESSFTVILGQRVQSPSERCLVDLGRPAREQRSECIQRQRPPGRQERCLDDVFDLGLIHAQACSLESSSDSTAAAGARADACALRTLIGPKGSAWNTSSSDSFTSSRTAKKVTVTPMRPSVGSNSLTNSTGWSPCTAISTSDIR